MRTTIDAAGRIVVPKALRDAMQLRPGQQIDIVYTDGQLEITAPTTDVRVEVGVGLPVAVPDEDLPALTSDVVRAVVDDTRR